MRALAAVFIAAHGIGYVIWFMSTWMPSVMGTQDAHLLAAPQHPATGVTGRLLGVLALVVSAGFLVSAWGVWSVTAWWPVTLVGSALVSLPVSLLIWSPVGIVSVPATIASLALVAATLLPWGERVLPPT
jgi:hypothetical protein